MVQSHAHAGKINAQSRENHWKNAKRITTTTKPSFCVLFQWVLGYFGLLSTQTYLSLFFSEVPLVQILVKEQHCGFDSGLVMEAKYPPTQITVVQCLQIQFKWWCRRRFSSKRSVMHPSYSVWEGNGLTPTGQISWRAHIKINSYINQFVCIVSERKGSLIKVVSSLPAEGQVPSY